MNKKRYEIMKGILFGFAMLLGFFCMGKTASAVTYQWGPISGDVTWTKQDSPIVIGDWFGYPEGAKITVEPGVVIKLAGNAPQLYIDHAFLNAVGTEAESIIITSYYDDSAGGDTDGDGGARQPQMGDWYRTSIGMPQMTEVQHVEFRYGRYCLGVSGDYDVRNNKFTNCNVGLNVVPEYSGNVESNVFEDNNIGVQVQSGGVYEGNAFRRNSMAMYLLWPSDNAPYAKVIDNDFIDNSLAIGYGYYHQAEVHNNNIYGNYWGAKNLYGQTASMADNWWGDPTGPYNPYINKDGKGNQVEGNITFSPWLGQEVVHKQKGLTPVIIVPGILGSAQKNGEWVLDPILHTYDNLVETLLANGYEDEKTLFKFPYDWRMSNVTTAIWLENRIRQAKYICGCDKVDIVAHSMGGLVARQYIQSDRYNSDVRKLIFLGTPHLGAPKTYLAWEAGEFGVGATDSFLRMIMKRQAKHEGFSDIVEYIHSRVPSTGELLPIYGYLNEYNPDSRETLARNYPTGYPQNIFLQSLNDSIDKLYEEGIDVTNIYGKDNAEDTIIGYNVISSIGKDWEHGCPYNYYGYGQKGILVGLGDKTVPEYSSSSLTNSQYIYSDHQDLPTKGSSRIFKILNKSELEHQIVNKKKNNYFLIVQMLSPADMAVVSPDGKKVGKDFATGEEVVEIDDAFYSGFSTENEFITIPDPIDGEYRIETQGTGQGGEYTVASALISDEGLLENDIIAQTKPGLIEAFHLNVDVTSGLLDSFPDDNDPPVIAIHFPQNRDYLHSEKIRMDAGIKDEGVGLLSQETRIDDIIQVGYEIDLFFWGLGEHTLKISAADYVGNKAEKVIRFRITATVDSTISDIERAYSLDWIDNQGIKESLIAKLKQKKINLKALENQLSAQRGKHVSEDAYKVIKEDINWLIRGNNK